MARPLRIEYSGAYYHVMSRGNRQQNIFNKTTDYENFLKKLEYLSGIYNITVISYCLMTNHFHLYIRTNEPNLSKFMQSFLTAYSIYKNRNDGICGHLFQGRFKSILVENDNYGAELTRYIHLNPIRISKYKNTDIIEKVKVLKFFEWSSFSRIIGLNECPAWIKRNITLKGWGKSLLDKQKNYSKFIESGIIENVKENLKSAIVAQSILGCDSFVDEIRRNMIVTKYNKNQRREHGSNEKINASVTFDSLLDIVSIEYNIEKKLLLKLHFRHESRQVLIYMASTYCRGRYSLTELCSMLGPISLSGISGACYNFKKKMLMKKEIKKRIKMIKEKLNIN